MLRINRPTKSGTWRDYAEIIKSARKELAQYANMMTPYERAAAEREINDLRNTYLKHISEGILEEHEAAIYKFQNAHLKVEQERKKEIAGWDAQKLSAEMQVYEKLIDQAVNSTGDAFGGLGKQSNILEETYQEAQQSGDKYKQRAIAEVMKSAPTKYRTDNQEIKKTINHLAAQSERDLLAVRNSRELKQACIDAEGAWDEYRAARQELITSVTDIGEPDPMGPFASGPYAQALRRVQVIDNKVHVFEPNAPEVTGVFVKEQEV